MGEADTHHQITVFVNEKPVTIYRGMQVQHALISYDVTVFQACERGELRVEDEHGFRVGLEGALREGSKIYTREAGGPCMPERAGAGGVEGRGPGQKKPK
jgi:hypothetical protein